MNRYLYDGSTIGLLSAIARLLLDKVDSESTTLEPQRPTLFRDGFFLATDPALVQRLCQGLRRKAPEAARTLSLALLAEQENLETSLLRFIALAFTHGDSIKGHLTHPAVATVARLARKVGRELHRMKGLLRFEQLADGSYLACMEPDHDILRPLALHFSHRLATQDWLIYDARRGRAACWHQGQLHFGSIDQWRQPPRSSHEQAIQQLWRHFFQSVAIPHRRNPHLQQSRLPMKYWKHLVELRDDARLRQGEAQPEDAAE